MKKYFQLSQFQLEDPEPVALRRYSRLDQLYVGYGLLIVGLVLLSYLMGAFKLLPHDPDQSHLELIMAPPGTSGYWLGTDFLGRDLLSRLILGIQAYFLPGLLAISIALSGGTLLGIFAAYRGGLAQTVITYFNNLIDSFPRLVLMLLVIAAFKPDIYYIMMVLGITGIPAVASAIAGKIRMLAQKNFIEAALALGLRKRVIIFKHILWYNCRSLLIIQATLGMSEAILLETSLSYLGFGVQEPTPSWGNMVQSGANYLLQGNFWPSTVPALAILLTILGFHLLGDGLNNMSESK
jgi:peptide/nickel transport system permease protein